MEERAPLVRLANKSVDAGELASSCQVIKDALDTFNVSYSCFFFLFQTTSSLTSLQVELSLLVERNTHNILKVCHLSNVIENIDILLALVAYRFPIPPPLP